MNNNYIENSNRNLYNTFNANMPYTIITTNPQQQMQQMQMQMQNTTHIPIPQHNKSNNIIIPAHSTAAASSGNSINKNSILLTNNNSVNTVNTVKYESPNAITNVNTMNTSLHSQNSQPQPPIISQNSSQNPTISNQINITTTKTTNSINYMQQQNQNNNTPQSSNLNKLTSPSINLSNHRPPQSPFESNHDQRSQGSISQNSIPIESNGPTTPKLTHNSGQSTHAGVGQNHPALIPMSMSHVLEKILLKVESSIQKNELLSAKLDTIVQTQRELCLRQEAIEKKSTSLNDKIEENEKNYKNLSKFYDEKVKLETEHKIKLEKLEALEKEKQELVTANQKRESEQQQANQTPTSQMFEIFAQKQEQNSLNFLDILKETKVSLEKNLHEINDTSIQQNRVINEQTKLLNKINQECLPGIKSRQKIILTNCKNNATNLNKLINHTNVSSILQNNVMETPNNTSAVRISTTSHNNSTSNLNLHNGLSDHNTSNLHTPAITINSQQQQQQQQSQSQGMFSQEPTNHGPNQAQNLPNGSLDLDLNNIDPNLLNGLDQDQRMEILKKLTDAINKGSNLELNGNLNNGNVSNNGSNLNLSNGNNTTSLIDAIQNQLNSNNNNLPAYNDGISSLNNNNNNQPEISPPSKKMKMNHDLPTLDYAQTMMVDDSGNLTPFFSNENNNNTVVNTPSSNHGPLHRQHYDTLKFLIDHYNECGESCALRNIDLKNPEVQEGIEKLVANARIPKNAPYRSIAASIFIYYKNPPEARQFLKGDIIASQMPKEVQQELKMNLLQFVQCFRPAIQKHVTDGVNDLEDLTSNACWKLLVDRARDKQRSGPKIKANLLAKQLKIFEQNPAFLQPNSSQNQQIQNLLNSTSATQIHSTVQSIADSLNHTDNPTINNSNLFSAQNISNLFNNPELNLNNVDLNNLHSVINNSHNLSQAQDILSQSNANDISSQNLNLGLSGQLNHQNQNPNQSQNPSQNQNLTGSHSNSANFEKKELSLEESIQAAVSQAVTTINNLNQPLNDDNVPDIMTNLNVGSILQQQHLESLEKPRKKKEALVSQVTNSEPNLGDSLGNGTGNTSTDPTSKELPVALPNSTTSGTPNSANTPNENNPFSGSSFDIVKELEALQNTDLEGKTMIVKNDK